MRLRNAAGIMLVGLGVAGAQMGSVDAAGTVTGHVICGDTQRPARLAQVRLVPVPALPAGKSPLDSSAADPNLENAGQVSQTSLDGSYALRGVKSGDYYLVVDKDGYISNLTSFSNQDLRKPSEATRVRIARELRRVSVHGEQTVSADLVLERGASVAGTVLYDDGSPASGLTVKVLEKGADGKWAPRLQNGMHWVGQSRTDDFGRYRQSGLPPGEYATEVDLILTDREVSSGPMPGHPEKTMTLTMEKTRYSLGLYSGDKLRETQAVSYTVGKGEDKTGLDLNFPLSKLHSVTGQIISKGGHVVNGGKLALKYADDQSALTETEVNTDEAVFRLDFVPEGEFILKTTGAKDVVKVQVENGKGFTPRFREEDKTVKTYGDAEQALEVKGETVGVVAMVPEVSKTPAQAK